MSQTNKQSVSVARQSAGAGAHAVEYQTTARFYDQLYADAAPVDLEFYLELARDCGGTVLELGCGTGRVVLPLARAGFSVTGVDNSPAMLEQLRAKLADEPAEVQQRITLVEGSMEGTDLREKFALVTMPFRAFQHLLTVEQQQAALGTVARHMGRDGLFVYNTFSPSLPYIVDAMRRGQIWMTDHQWSDPGSGRRYRRMHSLRYDPGTQVADIDWRFEEFDGGGRLLDTWIEPMQMRWTYRFEAEHLLRLSGFEIIAAYGDYTKTPLTDAAKELIYVCKYEGR